MKEIRIFIASSMELLPERNYLSYLTLALEGEFEKRGLRVRLSKWEYVDPRMTEERTEDRYLNEMYGCDAALVLFRNIAGMYTREELDKALAAERAGLTRLKTHEILFAADGAPDSEAARLRSSLPEGSYGTWSSRDELRDRFLALIDRVAQSGKLFEVSSGENVRTITAFLAADDELSAERDAFADTVLNVNDLLELAHRGLRVAIRFYDPGHEEDLLDACEMGLVIYGTNCRVFGKEEIERTYDRVKDASKNPKRFYVFFRDLDETAEQTLDDAFRTFRDDFVTKLGHFTCQFGDANALRLSFLLSLERYAGESVKEYYSTVTAPTAPVFAGREKELLKLCELLDPVSGKFPFGRLPVITGAGGTGKSELARQFAWQRRIGYPGGVFQVDMEHVKTWDDVFLGLLNGVPNNGSPVKDYLEIKNRENDADNSAPPITGAEVRDALLAKARQSGPVLLVLDNVESCLPLLSRDGGFRKAFPAGFSERVRVNVIATARVCDVMLRETDWAVPFPLADLSPEAALEVLLEDRSEADAAERKAAERVAELLGYRALYLRRVPALIGDLYAETICDSYAELVKSLEENLLATIAEETEETHLPEILWKMTRERLLKMPLGAECVKLVEVAAFFSPEGFPRHILLHLWKTVVAPDLDEKKFARAFEIVRHHNLFQSADPVRIHRLDRAAILHKLGGEDSEILDSIGRSLADYLATSREIWLSLAKQFPRVFQWIPDSIVNGDFYVKLLIANPILEDRCDWSKLNGADWVDLLEKQPQFAGKCDWSKLDGWDWRCLLEKQPQFAERCQWQYLNGQQWLYLLASQPRFAEKCPWDKLEPLPSYYPQYLNFHPEKGLFYHVYLDDWFDLLKKQKQFLIHFPWEHTTSLSFFNEYCWIEILSIFPQFADKCPWNKLNGRNWADLLAKQPQFADKCPWVKLDGGNWANLLREQPQFADKCPWEKLDGRNWANLLREQPQFADKCPWEKLDGGNWASLLRGQPQFAEKCLWEKLDGENWRVLLVCQPQFADRCDWTKLSKHDLGRLLEIQPMLADRHPDKN